MASVSYRIECQRGFPYSHTVGYIGEYRTDEEGEPVTYLGRPMVVEEVSAAPV